MKNLYKKAYEQYGILQKVVAMEELSELIKEISKDIRGELNIEHLKEEVVDCEIMLEQIKYIYNLKDIELFSIKQKKLKRLEGRIKNDEHNC